MLLITLFLLVIATIHDLRTREIPDWISVVLLVCAVVGVGANLLDTGWWGMLFGLLLSFAIGATLFGLGNWGGGDAKLIIALGALLGPKGLLITLFWMALAGGCLAVVAKARGQSNFAYVPALTIGLAAYVLTATVS